MGLSLHSLQLLGLELLRATLFPTANTVFRRCFLSPSLSELTMTPSSRQEAVLTSDIWAKILSHLNPVSQIFMPGACGRDFGSYNQLRLVNKQFSKLFEEHLELASCTYLRRDFAEEALPGLLQWLQKRGRALKTFVSECGSPCTEAALSALTSSASGLSTVIIGEASNYGISILSMFTSLTSCELAGADSDNLNLGALQTLAGLTALQLRDGRFYNLDQLASLTELTLSCGVVTFTRKCRFISSLQTLYMSSSLLSGTRDVGVSDFTALRWLHCDDSAVSATNRQDNLNTSNSGISVPMNLSSLTHLTCLDFTFACSVQSLDLQSVYALSSLEILDLAFESDAFVELGSSLTCLKELTTLHIQLCSGEQSCLVLKVPWQELPSLRCVELHAAEMQFDSDILGLTQLPFLQFLLLSHGRFVDAETGKYFGVLINHMALEAPHVICNLEHYSMLEHMIRFKRKLLKL